jgi:hypothetical protein
MAMSGVTQKNVMSNTKIKAIEATAEDLIHKEKEFVQRLSAIQETTIRCLIAELLNRPGDECDQHVKLGNFCERKFVDFLEDYIYNTEINEYEDFRDYLMKRNVWPEHPSKKPSTAQALLADVKEQVAKEETEKKRQIALTYASAQLRLNRWLDDLAEFKEFLYACNEDDDFRKKMSVHWQDYIGSPMGDDVTRTAVCNGWLHICGRCTSDCRRLNFEVCDRFPKDTRLDIKYGTLTGRGNDKTVATGATVEEALGIYETVVKNIMVGNDHLEGL